MEKFYIEILVEKWNHAGTKAREDLALFLDDAKVTNLVFDKDVSKIERVLFTKHNIKRKLSYAKKGDVVIISHRLFFGIRYSEYLLKIIKQKGLKSILLVHDIESLRQDFSEKQVSEEIAHINLYDVVISHNDKMTRWLKENGVTSNIVNLELFDYYNNTPIKESIEYDRKVIFAGNLEKSKFLEELDNFNNEISLYGPNPASHYPKNINYFGSFSPNELPLFLEGSYGLIWDGQSAEKCTGLNGRYLKFNNPHKTSLYLSCGLPVIIWKEAALASFVESNNIGITVNSLYEMDKKLSNISTEEYQQMKENTIKMAQKVRTGYFTKKAIDQAVTILLEEIK